MAINITPHTSTPIAPQDLTSAQGGATAPVPSDAAVQAEAAPENTPSREDQIAAHAGLVAQASQTTENLATGGVDADLSGEGARLLALNLRQSLGNQNLSIANQAPQALLSLLR